MLIAIDGSYDPELGLGAWAVVLARRVIPAGGGNPPRLAGCQRRQGRTPRWVASPHAAEAWALRMAADWCRRLGTSGALVTTDCASLAALLAEGQLAGIPAREAAALLAGVRRAGLRLVALDARHEHAALGAELHAQAHAAALRALRRARANGPGRVSDPSAD